MLLAHYGFSAAKRLRSTGVIATLRLLFARQAKGKRKLVIRAVTPTENQSIGNVPVGGSLGLPSRSRIRVFQLGSFGLPCPFPRGPEGKRLVVGFDLSRNSNFHSHRHTHREVTEGRWSRMQHTATLNCREARY